jgi:hypothetical protein
MCGHDDDELSLAKGSLPHKREEISPKKKIWRNLQKRNQVFKILFFLGF